MTTALWWKFCCLSTFMSVYILWNAHCLGYLFFFFQFSLSFKLLVILSKKMYFSSSKCAPSHLCSRVQCLKNYSPYNSKLKVQVKSRNIRCAWVLLIIIFNFCNNTYNPIWTFSKFLVLSYPLPNWRV